MVHSSEKSNLKLLEIKTPFKNCFSSQRLVQTRTTWSWSCWGQPPCQRQRSEETFEYWTTKELFEVDIGISSTAGDLVVIAVWGVSNTIHPVTHQPSNILLRSPSAHSKSVLNFPNNIYRHICYCLSSVKRFYSINSVNSVNSAVWVLGKQCKQFEQCQQCKQCKHREQCTSYLFISRCYLQFILFFRYIDPIFDDDADINKDKYKEWKKIMQ